MHRPWAWCWWPATDLIRQDPDVTDARDPRTISTLDVDWLAVLQAVRYAVERCPVGPEALHLESVDVELPMPLRKIDYDMVASWVGAATPVTYWYEEDQIEDGRHRLWLTPVSYTHLACARSAGRSQAARAARPGAWRSLAGTACVPIPGSRTDG